MTIITFPYTETGAAHPHLRRFDLRRDLLPVADLVELCFQDSLDVDGRRYIMQMRSTARHPQFLRWATGMADRMAMPFSGFVWEQDGQVVGNLSLIPMHSRGRRIFLIANVAVHPEHRRRGIARSLTEAALSHSAGQRADQVWLHVRSDNPGALALYSGLGFVEKYRRTTWHGAGDWGQAAGPPGVRIVPRRREHWPLQLAWLDRAHPTGLLWYLPLDLSLLQPGLFGWLRRLVKGDPPRMWAATENGRLLGVLAWVRSGSYSDRLWLAVEPQNGSRAIPGLMAVASREIRARKAVNLEYPTGWSEPALEEAGLEKHHTLIWMKAA